MELMSTLLFWALLATAPLPLLGDTHNADLNELAANNKPEISRTKILLNKSVSPQANQHNELQKLFTGKCKPCVDCMEHAMKANRFLTHMDNTVSGQIYSEIFHRNDLQQIKHPYKRSVSSKSSNYDIKPKLVVTKYANGDGKLYAIRLKEMMNETNIKQSCDVITIKKVFPCKSREGEKVFAIAKKKSSKKNKKSKKTTTSKP